jgi:hypothetical protein
VRWLTLYLRSRRAPVAMIGTAGCAAAMWSLWSAFSNSQAVGFQMVVLTILLLVVTLTATLTGPDDALEGTAALRWPPRRAAHLLAIFLVVAALPLVTLTTGARFGPAWLIVRDTAGLLGLTALGAATIGTARAWFVPLGWTLAAVLFPHSASAAGRILTWQVQPPAATAATATAVVLALGGLVAYAVAGPARRTPAEAGQQ